MTPASIFAAAVLSLLVGCGPPKWTAELEPLPQLDLSVFETAVQGQIGDAMLRIERAQEARDRKKTAAAYGSLGGILHNYELYEAAAICLENALRLDPEDLRWNYYLAIVEQAKGNLSQAIEYLEKTVELAPDYLPARVRLGELWITTQKPDRAREQLELALELDADCALAHFFLGRAALAMHENEAAVEHFQRSLALQPQAKAVHHLLAQTYREQGDLEQAERELKLRGEAVVTIRDPLYLELGELDLGAAARIRRGARAQVAGDYDTALKEYRQAVAADPDNPEARQSLGGVLVRKGENRAAIEQYRAALRLAGEDPLVLSNLGAILMVEGEGAEARQMLERAVALDPTLQNARLALGAILMDEGRPAEALAHYRAVLARDRGNAEALLGEAQSLAATGDSDGAVASLEEAVGSNASSETRARIHAELGTLFARRRDAVGALHQFEAAISLDPRLARARFARANLLGGLGRFREAAAEYSEVTSLVPGSVAARLGGATASAMAGDYSRAKDFLEQGLGEAADPQLEHALARLLVTMPDASLRDATRGLALAKTAHRRVATMETAETLALALAAAGHCAEAVEKERQLRLQAERAGNRGLAARVATRLRHFQETGRCLPPWST